MNKSILFVLLSAGAIFGAPVAAQALEGQQAEPAGLDGAVVYRDNCNRCHQPRTPADLSPSSWQAVAMHMRVRAILTTEEYDALKEFLVPTQSPEPVSSALPAQITESCVSCHDSARIEAGVAAGWEQVKWDDIITRMRTYGAVISAEDSQVLAAELSKSQ